MSEKFSIVSLGIPTEKGDTMDALVRNIDASHGQANIHFLYPDGSRRRYRIVDMDRNLDMDNWSKH